MTASLRSVITARSIASSASLRRRRPHRPDDTCRMAAHGWPRDDVGVLPADEKDLFPTRCRREFRRKHIADEGISQRDQVHIRSKEKSRKILKWNQARSVNGHAPRAKLAFDPIRLRPRGIQPEPKAVPRLMKVFCVRLDESVLIVRNAPIARVKDDPRSAPQLIRQR